jgi:GNAT superfamily N-acetyltransferase
MCPSSDPPSKRVRFDPSAVPPAGSPTNIPVAKLDANDVVQIRLAYSAADVPENGAPHDSALCFRPKFTHQIFPAGISGLKSATAALYFTGASLHCWLDCEVCPLDQGSESNDSRLEKMEGPGPAEGRDFVSSSGQDATTEASLRETMGRYILAGQVSSRGDFVRCAERDSEHSPAVAAGDAVSSYRVTTTSGDRQFSIFRHNLAASKEIRDYHKRMQLLMFLYIDGASFVDDTDSRWEIFVVLEHVNGAPRYLVGYATVYPFSAIRPGKQLDAGFAERIRISQVFILPQHQRGGHGSRLLSAIYENAHGRDAFEVTVEDPSEGFRLLRDMTDLRRAYAAGVLEPDVPVGLDKCAAVLALLRERLLLTQAQARRCLEVHNLRFVDREDGDAYKKYRLWIKRRIHEEYLEVLDAFTAGDERRGKLAEIYADYEREYLCIVSRLGVKMDRI